MNEPSRLGVVGTMVWDRIVDLDGSVTHEGWGGIAYSLAALEVALPSGWSMVPIVKVGQDLAEQASDFLGRLQRLDASRVATVAEPNNRVDLRYRDAANRTEQLTGGVGAWSADDLFEAVSDCDALLVNFISGHELELDTAIELRRRFGGRIYADLHSLFLDVGPDGTRVPEPLARWDAWLRCFDVVQMNEEELGLLSGAADPWPAVEAVLGQGGATGPVIVVVTLGARGARYVESASSWSFLEPGPEVGSDRGHAEQRIVRGDVTLPAPRVGGDPTGAGDVWGAAMLSRLLHGDEADIAAAEANRMASLAVAHSGAEGLVAHLRASRDDQASEVENVVESEVKP